LRERKIDIDEYEERHVPRVLVQCFSYQSPYVSLKFLSVRSIGNVRVCFGPMSTFCLRHHRQRVNIPGRKNIGSFFGLFIHEVNFIATTGQHASGEYLISCALKGASIPKTLENGLIWGLHNVRQLVYVIRQGEERQPISVWMEAVYLAVYGLRCCSIEILFRTPDPPQDRMPFFLRSF